MSGLGKGVVSSSISKLLQLSNQKVSCVKIDPYLNFDAGTMNPIAHGEVFVTEDGGECDMDIGNYERYLNQNIPKSHNITTAQIYSSVIEAERKGKYLGACVQIIPHVTDEIKNRIRKIASDEELDILVVECGGTVGDIESLPFLEALRQIKVEEGPENVIFVHVTLAPSLDVVGEQKTKPTQHSVKEYRTLGVQPDILICRSDYALPQESKEKIALFCSMPKDGVISFISPSAETSTRTFEITIEADNADLSFKSGITTKITIAGSELKAHKIPPSILTLLDDGTIGRAAVPSGASTGKYEAIEKRDSDSNRYIGKGVLNAVNNIHNNILPLLREKDASDLFGNVIFMLEADGSGSKENFGANAILAVSMACAKAVSISMKINLHEYLANKASELNNKKIEQKLPIPMLNILNGGAHADNPIDFQEFMIRPFGFNSFSDSLRCGVEIFHTLKKTLEEKNLNTSVGDEGGFAPNLETPESALDLIMESIEKAGYKPGEEVNLCLDVAATESVSYTHLTLPTILLV